MTSAKVLSLLALSTFIIPRNVSAQTQSHRDLPETAEASKSSQKFSRALQRGVFDVETRWMTTQQTSSEVDVLNGRVGFKANSTVNVDSCGDISFIQIAKILDNQGRNFEWPMGQETRNKIRTQKRATRGVEDGWFVDHDDTKCQDTKEVCSPFYRDSWPNTDDGSRDGQNKNNAYSRAVLVDYPFGWEVISSAQLETCAVCRKDAVILGCVTWGGHWPATGERTLQEISSSETASNTFADALKNFNRHYQISKGPN